MMKPMKAMAWVTLVPLITESTHAALRGATPSHIHDRTEAKDASASATALFGTDVVSNESPDLSPSSSTSESFSTLLQLQVQLQSAELEAQPSKAQLRDRNLLVSKNFGGSTTQLATGGGVQPAPTSFPTASPTSSPTPIPTSTPTIEPTLSPISDVLLQEDEQSGPRQFDLVGANPTHTLGRCQGDCDADSDCMDGLVCHFRGSNDPIVGCTGYDTSPYDYCAPPQPAGNVPPPVAVPQPYFKMKLYWEEGYTWQDEITERRWCMVCEWGDCQYNAMMWIDFCDPEEYLYEPQRFRFFAINSEEIQIQVLPIALCFERDGNHIFLRTCDVTKPEQLWYAPNGSFTGKRFELSQLTNKPSCVTQHHHPKPDEDVELQACEKARHDETSYWSIEY